MVARLIVAKFVSWEPGSRAHGPRAAVDGRSGRRRRRRIVDIVSRTARTRAGEQDRRRGKAGGESTDDGR